MVSTKNLTDQIKTDISLKKTHVCEGAHEGADSHQSSGTCEELALHFS